MTKRNKVSQGVTGYYGCSCHPFKDWKEHDFYYKQKLKKGDHVRERHTGREGIVYSNTDKQGWTGVKYGTLPGDQENEHATNLIQIEKKKHLFKSVPKKVHNLTLNERRYITNQLCNVLQFDFFNLSEIEREANMQTTKLRKVVASYKKAQVKNCTRRILDEWEIDNICRIVKGYSDLMNRGIYDNGWSLTGIKKPLFPDIDGKAPELNRNT